MNLHDFGAYFGRFLLGALTFARDFWSSLRNGEFWKQQRVWWRANWVFACIAFLLASLLYFRIQGELSHSGSRIIPVVVEVLGEENATFANVVPREIKVEVNGAESDVRKFETSTEPIRLSVSKEKLSQSSERGVPITIKERRDIPGLRELGLRYQVSEKSKTVFAKYDVPGDVEFSIEKPKTVGTPKRGEVGEIHYSPDHVKLHGGQNWLRSLKDKEVLQLEPVVVEGLPVGRVEVQRRINLPESLAKAAKLSFMTNVTVSLEILPSEKTRVFDRLPIRFSMAVGTELPKGCRLTPQYVSATISGYEKSMNELSSADVTAYALIPSVAALDLKYGATNTIPIKLEVAPDKDIWTVNPVPSAVKLIMPSLPPAATNAPVRHAATNSPALPAATNVLVRLSATNVLVRLSATNAPALSPVTNVPVRLSATNSLALSPVTNVLVRLSATNAPAFPPVTNLSVTVSSAAAGVAQPTSNNKTKEKDRLDNGKQKKHE